MRQRVFVWVCLLGQFIGLAAGGASWAQTAGQVTADDYAPPPRAARAARETPVTLGGGQGAPAGAERLYVRLGAVEIAGEFAQTAALSQALRARLLGQEIAVSEIFHAASALEAGYALEGYALARVVVPAQELHDGGTLRLEVVDGFVEEVALGAVPRPLQARFSTLAKPLLDAPQLRLATLERQLLLMSDTYGVTMASALARGARPRGTLLVVEPDYAALGGYLGLDTSYAPRLGGHAVQAGLDLNSAFGAGEVLYLRLNAAPRLGDTGVFAADPRLRTLSAGTMVPLGADGLRLGAEATASRTAPAASGPVQSLSRFERAALKLSYPLQRARTANLHLDLAFDWQDDRQNLRVAGGDFALYHDKTRVLRLGGEGDADLGVWGRVAGRATLSRGIDGFGARHGREDMPLSRQAVTPDFTKFHLSVELTAPLLGASFARLNAEAQSSFGAALPAAEHFGIAHGRAVGALEHGALSGDSGWLMRVEITRPQDLRLSNQIFLIAPYLHLAVGEVHLAEPTALEQPTRVARSWGGGVDVTLPQLTPSSTASLRLDYSKGSGDGEDMRGDALSLVALWRF